MPDATHYAGSGSVVVQSNASPQATGTTARAMFIAREDCGTEQIGPCSIRFCGPDPETLEVSAGALTLDSSPPLVIQGQSYQANTYYSANTTSPAFHAGEMRTLVASGGDVPAFSSTFVAAAAAVMTSPSAGAGITVGSDDLQLAWTGGSGFVDLVISDSTQAGRCRFDASAGVGSVPNAALRFLGEPGAPFVFATSVDVTTSVPDWTIITTASVDASWPDGTAAAGKLSVLSP